MSVHVWCLSGPAFPSHLAYMLMNAKKSLVDRQSFYATQAEYTEYILENSWACSYNGPCCELLNELRNIRTEKSRILRLTFSLSIQWYHPKFWE
jgi:hypothetical protein